MTDPNAARSGWPPNCDGNECEPIEVPRAHWPVVEELLRRQRRRERLSKIVFWTLNLALGGLLGWVAHS
jgi:hypothetical protein